MRGRYRRVMAMEKSQRSLNTFVRETVAAGPIRTLRTGGSVRIVDAFFMGTADDAVGNHSRAGSVRLEKGHDLLADGGITTHIQLAIGKPALEKIRFVIVGKSERMILTATFVASLSVGPYKAKIATG